MTKPRFPAIPWIPSYLQATGRAIAAALGLHFGGLTVDTGYNYIKDESRSWNNPSGDVKVGPATITRVTGKFEKAYAHIFALNVTYQF